MEKIIEVRGLVKSYGEIEAVRGIDFYVERGRLFAFLGPNGAGKSTTVEILSTALKKDAGEVVINGFTLGREDDEIRSSMGVVFQGNFLDDRLTVRGNLLTRGSFYGLKGKELEEAVEQAAYEAAALDFMEQRYGSLWRTAQAGGFGRGPVNRPKILFLDEPTTGLDAQTRRSVWEYIRRMQEQRDMTVFLTTHYMEEAAQADYVLVIDHGLIAAKGTPAQLKEAYASDQLRLYSSRVEEITAILREMGLNFEQRAGFVTASIPTTLQALPIVERCRDYLSGFEVLQGTMDDAFLAITGRDPLMTTLAIRNLKIFFRDRASVFFSLLAVLIIIGLYAAFLGDTLVRGMPDVPGARFLMDSWIMAGLLAVTSLTSTMGAAGVVVEDRARGIAKDFQCSPLKKSTIVAGYLLAAILVGLIMTTVALIAAQVYIVASGGKLLPLAALLKTVGLIVLSTIASGSLVFFLTSFLKTPNAFGVASTVIGTLAGFLMGIYVPVSVLPARSGCGEGLSHLPCRGVLRQVMMEVPLAETFAAAPAGTAALPGRTGGNLQSRRLH